LDWFDGLYCWLDKEKKLVLLGFRVGVEIGKGELQRVVS
jgi:hypothetical protein